MSSAALSDSLPGGPAAPLRRAADTVPGGRAPVLPLAALLVDAAGLIVDANPVAVASFGAHVGAGQSLDALGIDAAALAAAPPHTGLDCCLQDTQGQPRQLRVSAGEQGGLRLLLLTPIDDLHAEAQRARKLSEQLEVAQDFGRLGIWERDIRSMEGYWDRHVYRFWGLPADAATPSFADATRAIMTEDRPALDRNFLGSLKQAGTYSHRYRVRRPDGTVRQIHSQWVVRNGADGQPQRVLGIMMDDTEAWQLAQSHDTTLTQLSAAVELARIAIWRRDARTGQIQLNGTASDILGIEHRDEPIPGAELLQRLHPEDRERFAAMTQQACNDGNPQDFEVRFLRDDGQCRTVMGRRSAIRDADGTVIAMTGVGMDITEQREGTRRAEDMVRRFELATRTAGIGYWSLDHGVKRPRWSDQLWAIHGVPPGGQTPTFAEWIERSVHVEDREPVRQAFRDWRHSGRPALEVDMRLLRSDGAVVDVITHTRVEGPASAPLLFGVVIDVTERRAAELALRQVGERAALTAQGVGLGTWEYELTTGATDWDEQMWRLRGRDPQPGAMSLEERSSIVHADDVAMTTRMHNLSISSDKPIDYEFRVRWPDGSWHWLASRSVVVHDGEGRPVKRIGVNWDISEARSAVIAREEKAAAQREVQAKSQFLSRMSHELRTPLNAVLGFTQLLLTERDTRPDSARRRRLEHIRSAGEHLLSLIDDVLDLSRLEGGEMSVAMVPTPLRPLVDPLLPLLDPLLRQHGISIVTGALDAVPMADPTRLRQVLLNLLTNAVKYNVKGGSVTIDARASQGMVMLRIVDTGRGMTAEQQRHLFEPFNRLGAEASGVEGTGIGLAIVKALVERMGGHVEVSSAPGAGSSFTLHLRDAADAPLAALPMASPQALALAATAPPTRRAHGVVLYIEDNPVNAMIVGELLARRSDLTLHIAPDGLSGIELAQRVKPDLLLLDMQLPDIDGHTVFERLKADPATAAIPCIALSANAMPADIDRALGAGFSDYWTKPLDFRAFTTSIEALFGPAPV